MSETNSSKPRLTYRVNEVSRMLGVPRTTVYRWVAEGSLPATQVGRILLIPVDAIERLLQRTGSPAH